MNRRTLVTTLASITTAGMAAAGAARAAPAEPAMPRPQTGRIERIGFTSRHVDARPVDVWLPPGYAPGRPHAVLYMHDGQMLFDASITWNKQAWNADVVAAKLMAERGMRDTIIVAVPNTGTRRSSEYFPERFLDHLPAALRERFVRERLEGRPRADAYLRFLVEDVKPAIDRRYATRPEREHTALMGSSMGGLISLYGLCEHPRVFGGAGCLSTHWPGGMDRNPALPIAAFTYLRDKLPDPAGVRLWMDHGTTGLDAAYGSSQVFVDEILRFKGYGPAQWTTRVFEGTGHDEVTWHARLHLPMSFVLGPT